MGIIITFSEGALSIAGSGQFIAEDEFPLSGYSSASPSLGTNISLTGVFAGNDVLQVLLNVTTNEVQFRVNGVFNQNDLTSFDPGFGGYGPYAGAAASFFDNAGTFTTWAWTDGAVTVGYTNSVTYTASWS